MATIQSLIFDIESAPDHRQRLEYFHRLEAVLEEQPSAAERRHIIALLYHSDWYIRREAAFLIDRLGIPLNESEQLQFEFALQLFQRLYERKDRQPEALELLFQGCLDPSPRIRLRIAFCLQREDCRTVRQEVLWHYAAGDYRTLLELGCEVDYAPAVAEILRHGWKQKENPLYHRKQCAFCLEQLKLLEDARSEIDRLLNEQASEGNRGEGAVPPVIPQSDPLQQLIHTLQRRGVRVRGKRLYPEIQIGSLTGRITYRNPPLQTWPKAQREAHIQPEEGMALLGFDFCAMEPGLLINFLLKEFLLSLEDVPPGDLYLALGMGNRETAKRWLNALINGAKPDPHIPLNPLQLRLLEAIHELQQTLLARVHQNQCITTLDGRQIPLSRQEKNLAGKAMNRLIQGSAADVFHRAVLDLDAWCRQHQPLASIYFLLFDEVWVQVPEEQKSPLLRAIPEVLLQVNEHYQFIYPLRVRGREIGSSANTESSA